MSGLVRKDTGAVGNGPPQHFSPDSDGVGHILGKASDMLITTEPRIYFQSRHGQRYQAAAPVSYFTFGILLLIYSPGFMYIILLPASSRDSGLSGYFGAGIFCFDAHVFPAREASRLLGEIQADMFTHQDHAPWHMECGRLAWRFSYKVDRNCKGNGNVQY